VHGIGSGGGSVKETVYAACELGRVRIGALARGGLVHRNGPAYHAHESVRARPKAAEARFPINGKRASVMRSCSGKGCGPWLNRPDHTTLATRAREFRH